MPKTTKSKTAPKIATAVKPAKVAAPKERTDNIAAGQAISHDERQRRIAEAAYFRAERRGFQGGDALQDWLEAEREVDFQLLTPAQQKKDKLAYEKLHKNARQILDATRDKISLDTIRSALNQAATQLKQIGEHTAESVDRMAANVERDLLEAARRIASR